MNPDNKPQISQNQRLDLELIKKYKDGHDEIIETILDKYKYLVRKIARKYFIVGGEDEDLLQEGMIALVRAVQTYSHSSDVSFYYYAKMLIERQMINAVKASNRKKHMPLNTYVSFYLSVSVDESNDIHLEDLLASEGVDPEQLLINKERADGLIGDIYASLSSFEKQVLKLHLDGFDYRIIAQKLDKSSKSIDNALQRIKKKTEIVLGNTD